MSDFPNDTPEWVRLAKVGDKVVSTGQAFSVGYNAFGDLPLTPPLPKGRVYEIRAIRLAPRCGQTHFHVGEYDQFGHAEFIGWHHFRPVSKRSSETGMETLRRIASTTKLPEDA